MTALLPGYRFAAAPRFHLPADWPCRLLVGAGLEEADGCFYPHRSWRSPTPDELALLVCTPEEPEACLCLFQLPRHLRLGWWKLLEQEAELLGAGELPGFAMFAKRVGEFLAFKNLPVPEEAHSEVVVCKSGHGFVRWGPQTNRPAGLLCNLAPWAPWRCAKEQRWPRLWGGINLGDEETSVVVINLSCAQLASELHRRFPDQPEPAAAGELVEGFLRGCPDYPPVRLTLRPGDGFQLPQGGLILDGYAEDKQEPDVLLLISHLTPNGSRFAPVTGEDTAICSP